MHKKPSIQWRSATQSKNFMHAKNLIARIACIRVCTSTPLPTLALDTRPFLTSPRFRPGPFFSIGRLDLYAIELMPCLAEHFPRTSQLLDYHNVHGLLATPGSGLQKYGTSQR